jgi:hypothetical protein
LVPSLVIIYVWFQVFVPTIITIIACVLLPIRFLINKRKLQRVQWRRARRMIVQMSTIASTYTFCWLPYRIILQLATINRILLGNYYISMCMIFDSYIPSLLTQSICFHTISGRIKFDLLQRIFRSYFPLQQATVKPMQFFIQKNLIIVYILLHVSSISLYK